MELWRRNLSAVVWHELNKRKLVDQQCIMDITWGPHRRLAKAGAPSRPRVLESKMFQMLLAYRMIRVIIVWSIATEPVATTRTILVVRHCATDLLRCFLLRVLDGVTSKLPLAVKFRAVVDDVGITTT